MSRPRQVVTSLLVSACLVGATTWAAGRASHIESGAVASERATRVTPRTVPDAPARIVGYFPSWGIYERGSEVADIHVDLLTHVNYAFADLDGGRCVVGDPWADVERPLPSDDPSLPYRGNFNQLQVLKQRHPGLRTVLSVGGSTWSAGFADAASTDAKRSELAASCVELVERYGFDGLSIDWEYPSSAPERADLTDLLRELRRRFDVVEASGAGERLLTLAGPAGAPNMAWFDIAAIAPIVDWVNVMTYDFAGPWSPATGHNSALYPYDEAEDPTFNIESALGRWNRAGMPKSKLHVGLPFYGRGFGGVTSAIPGASFTATPQGTTEPGLFDYSHLLTDVLPGLEVRYDEAARVPYAYDADADVFYSFDDERSIEEKARFARTAGYAGVLVWDLSNDTDDGALLAAANRGVQS